MLTREGDHPAAARALGSAIAPASQNHRMLGAGRDLCGSSSPAPLPKQGKHSHAASLYCMYQILLTVLLYLRLQSTGDMGLSQLCLREVDIDLTSVGKDSSASCRSSSLPVSSGHSGVLVPSSGTAAQEQMRPLFRKWQSASPYRTEQDTGLEKTTFTDILPRAPGLSSNKRTADTAWVACSACAAVSGAVLAIGGLRSPRSL